MRRNARRFCALSGCRGWGGEPAPEGLQRTLDGEGAANLAQRVAGGLVVGKLCGQDILCSLSADLIRAVALEADIL